MEIIIASNNEHKIAEYRKMFEKFGYSVISQNEANINIEVEETGNSFSENASLKAQAIYDITHNCVISDDSGLQVEALNNEPGIYSARYKGLKTEKERNDSILEQLNGIDNRKARFICVICFIDENGIVNFFEGRWEGNIALEASGTNGFGYDPIFIPNESNGKTTASMPKSFKEEFSHRRRALDKLFAYFNERGK